jgi:hypothetical protein
MIVQINQALGLNNVDSERKVQKYTLDEGGISLSGDFAKSSNFRIPKDGLPVVRNGFTGKYTGTAIGVIWSNKAQSLCLFTDGTGLYKLNDDYTATSLYASLQVGMDMAFEEHNNKVFMGNTVNMLRYVGGVVGAWANTTGPSSEFDTPQLVYEGLPNSNILLSYGPRMYAAWGRFVFYSHEEIPERWRKAWYLTAYKGMEDVTALSCEPGVMYIHTLERTYPLMGYDPDDFVQGDPVDIGAIPHFPGIPRYLQVPIWMSRKGWATAAGGKVQYLDRENFRVNVGKNAKCYCGYDNVKNELFGRVKE